MKRCLILAFLLLCGCATNHGKVWYKYGESSAQIQQAMYECDYESTKFGQVHTPYGLGLGAAVAAGIDQSLRRNELFVKCMQAKGYRLVDRNSVLVEMQYNNNAAPPQPETVVSPNAPANTPPTSKEIVEASVPSTQSQQAPPATVKADYTLSPASLIVPDTSETSSRKATSPQDGLSDHSRIGQSTQSSEPFSSDLPSSTIQTQAVTYPATSQSQMFSNEDESDGAKIYRHLKMLGYSDQRIMQVLKGRW